MENLNFNNQKPIKKKTDSIDNSNSYNEDDEITGILKNAKGERKIITNKHIKKKSTEIKQKSDNDYINQNIENIHKKDENINS